MNCPKCGSEVTGARCSVCGNQIGMDPVADTGSSVELAGWWRRVGATFADDLILVLPTLLVTELFSAIAGSLAGVIAAFALQGVYMVHYLSSLGGQTMGNRIAASRVRDALTGHTISRQQATRRWAFIAAYGALSLFGGSLTYITAVVGLIDVLYPLFDSRKQTLHDKFAGTIVVKA